MNMSKKYQRGVSLLEILITLVVIAIGMLGVLSLQLNAKRVNYDSVQRTLASGLVQNITERMRANTSALDSYVTAGVGLGGSTLGGEPNPDCSSGNECTGAELAAHDLWDWERAIDGVTETRTDSAGTALTTGGLVNPTACITHNAGTVTVTVAWYGSMALSNPGGNACGAGIGRYDTADARRQIFTLTTFIDNTL